MIDLHLHTGASHDGLGSVSEFCEAAISKGIRIIAITEHLDLDPGLFHANAYNHESTLAELEEARDRYRGKLTILTGLEVTYQSDLEDSISCALEDINADFVIGSIHILGRPGHTITEEEGARNYFKDKQTAREAFEPFFEETLEAVKSGFFDVLGHIDVIKRYGGFAAEPLRAGDYYGVLRRIIEGLIRRDMALEVNSSGLYHHAQEIYPSADILRLYRELGGRRITFGSDAHKPGDVGRGFDHAVRLIKSHRFSAITFFERRSPKEVPLP